MEPRYPLKRVHSIESPPTRPQTPEDADDYFELAYEIDEFGVHVPEYLAVK
jgi:hypothetical protein